jgi:hypothetical protein
MNNYFQETRVNSLFLNVEREHGWQLQSVNKILLAHNSENKVVDVFGWVSVSDSGNIIFCISHIVLENGVCIPVTAEDYDSRCVLDINDEYLNDEILDNILQNDTEEYFENL